MKKQFDYIQDAGHGWVKVPLSLIRELGIAEKITRYSYYNKGQVYLEEDNDTCTFMNAYHERFGFDPKLRDRVARERRSRVRGYDHYDSARHAILQEHVQDLMHALRAMGKLEIIHVG
jgi:hypothetical protein